jgi:hypothetical protein
MPHERIREITTTNTRQHSREDKRKMKREEEVYGQNPT